MDAAIASNAVLGVTEPMMTGMGGDLFVMFWDAKTGKLTGLNASGPSPKALSPAFLAQHDIKTMPGDGIHAVTIPGAVQGWLVGIPGPGTRRPCVVARDTLRDGGRVAGVPL